MWVSRVTEVKRTREVGRIYQDRRKKEEMNGIVLDEVHAFKDIQFALLSMQTRRVLLMLPFPGSFHSSPARNRTITSRMSKTDLA